MIRLLRDLSLRAKITISFVLIVICGTSISTFLGSKIITSAMLNEARNQVQHGLKTAEMVYATHLADVRKSVVNAADAQRLTTSLLAGKGNPSASVLAQLRDENHLHFLTFIPAADRKVARASGITTPYPEKFPDNIAALLKNARKGATNAGAELLSHEAFALENPALSEIAIGKGNNQEAMVLISAAPVRMSEGGAGLAGVIYGGILLNGNIDFVHRINEFVFGIRNEGEVSLFLKNSRIAISTLSISEAGQHLSPDIQRIVLAEGARYYGNDNNVGGRLAACVPMRNHANAIIGALYIGIPESPFLQVRTSMMLTFLLVAGIGVIVVLLITIFITRSMIHPLEQMVKASNKIAAGDLDHSVEITSNDEIGTLADSFNKMLTSIKTMKLELEEWGRTLEEKVHKRTEELVVVRTQMAQSEKLASIGRLAAGVAHEINNPLGGILTFSMLALEDCKDDDPLKQSLEVIVKQTLRCRDTVKGLLDFARQSSPVPSITAVNSVVDKTLLLLENQTMMQNVRTERKFDQNLPDILFDAGQLQQVVMNIVINAVDAMEESGVLTIETVNSPQTKEILIKISDTGKGVPDEALPFIFEPFFTTKEVGKGTGLGLAIVHGIVTRAGGKIEVTSSNIGTTFTVSLPQQKSPLD